MTININNIDNDLIEQTKKVFNILNIAISNNGYILKVKKSSKFNVSFNGTEFLLEYPTTNLYFRGLQLIKRYGVKQYSITEKVPSELGVMVDCSRNAVRTVSTFKKFISYIALMGYNQLYLYIEDTYEISDEPFFGYMRGRYSEAELKEIDDYAYSFGIEVIPCIQTLAHLNQIFRWRTYKECQDIDSILLIDDQKTYQLIEKMIKAVSSCFRSNKIHIGMDEAHMTGRGKYEDIHGNNDRTEILINHLRRVLNITNKYKLYPMIWSDMIYRSAYGGFYGEEKSDNKLINENDILKNVRLVYWDYNGRIRYEKSIKNHLKISDNISFACGAWSWLGFAPHNSFAIEENEISLKVCDKYNIDKIMITIWGDGGAECSLFSSLPSIYFTSEYCFGYKNGNREYFKDLTGISFEDFMFVDLPDVLEDKKIRNVNNPSKYILYNDFLGGIYDWLVKSDGKKIYSEYIKCLKKSKNEAREFKYIFETLISLCDVMKIKYDIGVKTRIAYKAKDSKQLKKIVKEYYDLVKRIEKFHKVFNIQWNKENKFFGFEVQDFRLGGLKMRAKSCQERLKKYLKGEINNLEELEIKQLTPYSELADINDFTACQVKFDEIITTNIL